MAREQRRAPQKLPAARLFNVICNSLRAAALRAPDNDDDDDEDEQDALEALEAALEGFLEARLWRLFQAQTDEWLIQIAALCRMSLDKKHKTRSRANRILGPLFSPSPTRRASCKAPLWQVALLITGGTNKQTSGRALR